MSDHSETMVLMNLATSEHVPPESAAVLTHRLAELLQRERHAAADFIVALADFHRERRWLELGYPNLFAFLHRELRLSRGAAYYKQMAAELAHRYPEVLDALRDGQLCITTVIELSKVITPENRQEVLPRFLHASKREAMAISAELRPFESPPQRAVVTRMVVPPTPADVPVQPVGQAPSSSPVEGRSGSPGESEPLVGARSVPPGESEVTPLTADLRRLHVTVTRQFVAKLEAAREALSHKVPDGKLEAVLEAALDSVLAQDARRKGFEVKPRKSRPTAPSSARHIPAEVKRTVWTRDDGACQWPVTSGGICASKVRVQVDHIVPVARGGPSTIANTRLLCAVHNQLSARQVFGDDWMTRCLAERQVGPARTEEPAPSGLRHVSVRGPA